MGAALVGVGVRPSTSAWHGAQQARMKSAMPRSDGGDESATIEGQVLQWRMRRAGFASFCRRPGFARSWQKVSGQSGTPCTQSHSHYESAMAHGRYPAARVTSQQRACRRPPGHVRRRRACTDLRAARQRRPAHQIAAPQSCKPHRECAQSVAPPRSEVPSHRAPSRAHRQVDQLLCRSRKCAQRQGLAWGQRRQALPSPRDKVGPIVAQARRERPASLDTREA